MQKGEFSREAGEARESVNEVESFRELVQEVKNPTPSHKTRQGWDTLAIKGLRDLLLWVAVEHVRRDVGPVLAKYIG